MRPAIAWERLLRNYRTRGLAGCMSRVAQKVATNLSPRPDVVYFVDLAQLGAPRHPLPDDWTIKERRSEEEITETEIETLYTQLGRHIVDTHIRERFGKGDSLWLISVDTDTAGMIWTELGGTAGPSCVPLSQSDLHLYDNCVFESFRGKGLNPVLLEFVLAMLKGRGYGRAYITTNWRNLPQRRSIDKTSLKALGVASSRRFLGRTVVVWNPKYDPQSLPDKRAIVSNETAG